MSSNYLIKISLSTYTNFKALLSRAAATNKNFFH